MDILTLLEMTLSIIHIPGYPAGRDLGAGPLELGDARVVGHAVGEEVEAEQHEDARELGGNSIAII